MKLTDDQIRAIQDLENNSVIMACPGSGKTTVLIHKMSLCCEKIKKYNGIVGLSFTNKSSQELKKRFQIINKSKNLNYIGTIDSFFINEIIKPFLPKIWIGGGDFEVVKILINEEEDFFSKNYENKKIEIDDVLSDPAFKSLYLYGKVLQNSINALALYVIQRSLSCRKYLLARYKYLFVDEYQDSSLTQHLVFLEFLKMGFKITVVGDIDQSIYKWREAVPENMISLIENYNFKKYSININHRCDPSIDLYARVFLTKKDELPLENKNIFCVHIKDAKESRYAKLDDLIDDIKKHDDELSYSDFAILCAKTAPLEHYMSKTRHNCRIYEDDPLDKISNFISKLCSDLFFYKYNDKYSLYTIFDKHDNKLKNISFEDFKEISKKIRSEVDIDKICILLKELIFKIDKSIDSSNCLLAVRSILENERYLKFYKKMDRNDLQLMTIYKAKGLEFKIVIHIGMEQWTFPSKSKDSNQNWVFKDASGDKNLHYVAITRAEKICYLVSMSKRVTKSDDKYYEKDATVSEFLKIERMNKHIIDLGEL
ncbi:ATP-dependent helicase [Acinetobacter johnsonii]|uniref:ATP-dependent helicase n=3 Tax=Acinetobacter TaxID=469 RepID=UPI00244C0057|nr:ATP-dependent helicase [Acinetobacter johnsonii]MDH1704561.1 ATP-dependent helicase [Acinetobacter johnsonii]